jgi:colanic acid biosynthesis protein WcaH
LGLSLKKEPKFIGVFEHFYDDGVFEGVSTHYLNLGYEINLDFDIILPKDQHYEYEWFTIDELLNNDQVHAYVKDYFLEERGTIPQNKKV